MTMLDRTNNLRPTMWAVVYAEDKGYIDPHSVRRTRREAIQAFVSDPVVPDWPYWYKRGCRAIRVRLVRDGDSGEGESC